MTTILNRPRNDNERRAMFARLKGGGSSRAAQPPADWKERARRAPDAPMITPSPEAQAARDRFCRSEFLDSPEWLAGRVYAGRMVTAPQVLP